MENILQRFLLTSKKQKFNIPPSRVAQIEPGQIEFYFSTHGTRDSFKFLFFRLSFLHFEWKLKQGPVSSSHFKPYIRRQNTIRAPRDFSTQCSSHYLHCHGVFVQNIQHIIFRFRWPTEPNIRRMQIILWEQFAAARIFSFFCCFLLVFLSHRLSLFNFVFCMPMTICILHAHTFDAKALTSNKQTVERKKNLLTVFLIRLHSQICTKMNPVRL